MLGHSTTPFTYLRKGRGFSPTTIEAVLPSQSQQSFNSSKSWNFPRTRTPLNNNSRDFCCAALNNSDHIENLTVNHDVEGIATALRNMGQNFYYDVVREDFKNNGVDVGNFTNPFAPERSSTPLLKRYNDPEIWGPQPRNPVYWTGSLATQEFPESFYPSTSPQSSAVQGSHMIRVPPFERMDNFAPLQQVTGNQMPVPQQTFRYNKKKKNNAKEISKQKLDHCAFCFNNGEDEVLVRSHNVRDSKGRTLCPKLRIYACEICGKDGDEAHTIKYCKQKRIITQEDTEMNTFKRKRINTRISNCFSQATRVVPHSLDINNEKRVAAFFYKHPLDFLEF